MAESAITFTSGEVSMYYAERVPQLRQRRAARWRGACPIHSGEKDSFTVHAETGRWFCHSECGRGGGIIDLEMELGRVDFKAAKAQVFGIVGRSEPDYRSSGTRKNGCSAGTAPTKPTKPAGAAGEWREVARYPYEDRGGNLLFEVVRYVKPNGTKTFIQVRPSGIEAVGTGSVAPGGIVQGLAAGRYVPDWRAIRTTGRKTWKQAEKDERDSPDCVEFTECPRVPYRLPKVLKAGTVYLVEGEKDVHTLEGLGLVASCNPGGSGSSALYAGWTEYFRGKDLVIPYDNDEPGRKHAVVVAASQLNAADSVRVLDLPGLPPKGDVTDWRDAGGTREELLDLVDAAPKLDPISLANLREQWGLGDDTLGREARPAEPKSLVTRRLSEVAPKPVDWLWPGWLARGKLTIFAGDPGIGKSQLTASIAAIVTSGGTWPMDGTPCVPRNVVLISAEDDAADTLRPRLQAAGAKLDRIHIVDAVRCSTNQDSGSVSRSFSLEADLEQLSQKLAEIGEVALIIIDPITAFLGKIDSHRNSDVRALLEPLFRLASQHGTAIIGISHLNKTQGIGAMMRVSGSLAFVAAARAGYLIDRDPADGNRRLFLPMKNNLGPDSTGLAFRIEDVHIESDAGPLQTSRVVWESQPVAITADEVLLAHETARTPSALRHAGEWLEETLRHGAIAATSVYSQAEQAGISRTTLQRAARSLGFRPKKTGMQSGWLWSLPPNMANQSEDPQRENLATFGKLGDLRRSEDRFVEFEL